MATKSITKTKLTWTENANVDVEVYRDQNIVIVRPRRRIKEMSVWWLGLSMFIHGALVFTTKHDVSYYNVRDLEGYLVCQVFFLVGAKKSLSAKRLKIPFEEQYRYDFGWLMKVGYVKSVPFDFKRYLAKDIEYTARFLKNNAWKKITNEHSRFRKRKNASH